MEYSLIIPVYKAEKTLPLLIPAVVKAMDGISGSYEVVLVDDRSPDKSWEILCALAEIFKQIRIVRLNKNYGQLAATTCGLQTAKGKVLLTMDDDLQFSPEEIPAYDKLLPPKQLSIGFWDSRKKNQFQITGLYPNRYAFFVSKYFSNQVQGGRIFFKLQNYERFYDANRKTEKPVYDLETATR